MIYEFVVNASDDVPTELLVEFNIQTMAVIYRGTEQEPEVAKKSVANITEMGQSMGDILKMEHSSCDDRK